MKQNQKTLSGRYGNVLRKLKREISRRKAVEKKLNKSERHYQDTLAQARKLQERSRHLSHLVILAQEEERKEISRELHDEIAQTLAGINLHLGTLKKEDAANTKELKRKISNTQRLVEKSLIIIHRFARDLRPTLLDDLGLIPALSSYIQGFTERTHIPVRFKSTPEVERLNNTKRTVFYRVAQSALSNVAQHADASSVNLIIQKNHAFMHMEVSDNGKSFNVEHVLYARRNKRLGLLGMRERVEMIGGVFNIVSTKGIGTHIEARIPL